MKQNKKKNTVSKNNNMYILGCIIIIGGLIYYLTRNTDLRKNTIHKNTINIEKLDNTDMFEKIISMNRPKISTQFIKRG